jgi:hypothetical protein
MIIPSQNVPFPEYPLLHVHVKLPKELAQVDCSSQDVPIQHSSISINIKTQLTYFLTVSLLFLSHLFKKKLTVFDFM